MNKLFSAKIEKLLTGIPLIENLARKKFVSAFILSIIKIKNVQFSELAYGLNDSVKVESNERRIQDFFENKTLDFNQVALLLCMFLPKGKVKLVLDRTEWDFGKCQVNILAITAYSQGVGLPIYFEMLDNKSGNSSTQDRCDLLKKCIALLGKERIDCIIGDREFIGKDFYKFLFDNGLNFFIRIRKSQILLVNGIELTVEQLLGERKKCLLDNIGVSGFFLSLAVQRIKDKKGNPDFLMVLTNTFAHKALAMYRNRWSIEVFFQSIKGRGFNLEESHLKDINKVKNLFAFVCIAFALCLSTGIEHHKKIQKIPVKNHTYKAKSFFRKGLDVIRNILRKDDQQSLCEFDNWIWKLVRLVRINLARYQYFIKIIG